MNASIPFWLRARRPCNIYISLIWHAQVAFTAELRRRLPPELRAWSRPRCILEKC